MKSKRFLPLVAIPFILLLLNLGQVRAQSPRDKGDDTLEQAKRRTEVATQRLEADLKKTLDESQKLLVTDSAKAIAMLQKALAGLDADNLLSETRRDAMKHMLKDRIRVSEFVAKNGAEDAIDLAARQAKEALKKADEDRRQAEQAKINQELKNINRLRQEGKGEEAARAAAELERKYDRTPAATAAARTTSTADRIQDSKRLQAEKERRTVGVIRDVERSAMPPAGDIEYPKDWAEKTKRREKQTMTAKEKAIMKALDTPISAPFKDSPFEDVIEYLQTVTGQTIILDKQALDEMQIKYDTPITLNARSLTMRTVLKKILSDLGLSYIVKDETIQVTSALKARETLTVRAYYIGDMLGLIDARLPPAWNAAAMIQAGKDLVEFIQSSIDPQSWKANGGVGSIVFDVKSMSIIVKQTAEVHFMMLSGK